MQFSLKAARVNAELTQAQVAKSIGISESTLIKWENRRTFPKSYQLEALCNLYRVPVDCISLTKSPVKLDFFARKTFAKLPRTNFSQLSPSADAATKELVCSCSVE